MSKICFTSRPYNNARARSNTNFGQSEASTNCRDFNFIAFSEISLRISWKKWFFVSGDYRKLSQQLNANYSAQFYNCSTKNAQNFEEKVPRFFANFRDFHKKLINFSANIVFFNAIFSANFRRACSQTLFKCVIVMDLTETWLIKW